VNLNDKDIANDILCMCKHGIEEMTKAALECTNVRLRETLRQDRNRSEQAHEELSNIATTNNWYLPAGPADHSDVRRVTSFLTQGAVGYTESPGVGGYTQAPGAGVYGSRPGDGGTPRGYTEPPRTGGYGPSPHYGGYGQQGYGQPPYGGGGYREQGSPGEWRRP